jgi:deoxyguanosine kinase
MKYNFIAIEGNIGAGKTTLAQQLSKKLHAKLILEQFAENPFLARFYTNAQQYAFPLELSFMTERYTQLKTLLSANDSFQGATVSDYMFTKCLLFASVNLPADEFNLYQTLFDILCPQLRQPDILIYLHASATKLQQNIKKRNRAYEQSIPDQYLLKIEEVYINYIKQHSTATLFINAGNADFECNEEHLKIILNALEKDYTAGRHYLALP